MRKSLNWLVRPARGRDADNERDETDERERKSLRWLVRPFRGRDADYERNEERGI